MRAGLASRGIAVRVGRGCCDGGRPDRWKRDGMELGATAVLGADACARASSSASSAAIQRTFLLHMLNVMASIQNANSVCESQ